MEILYDKRCAFALGKTESVLIILTLNGTLLELLVSTTHTAMLLGDCIKYDTLIVAPFIKKFNDINDEDGL